MILDQMKQFVIDFLERFIAKPPSFLEPYSLDQIVRCESTHFLFSCFLGWLVFSLTWIILSSNRHKWQDRSIFPIGVLFGLLASVTTHIFIDGFTTVA